MQYKYHTYSCTGRHVVVRRLAQWAVCSFHSYLSSALRQASSHAVATELSMGLVEPVVV